MHAPNISALSMGVIQFQVEYFIEFAGEVFQVSYLRDSGNSEKIKKTRIYC